MHRYLTALLILFIGIATGTAQTVRGLELVRPALVADGSAVVPGKPFMVGLHLRMAPHWHSYWAYPGDSGMATRIEWKLPAGFKAGEIQWPLPEVVREDGDMMTYAYNDEVLLMVEITPPAELTTNEVRLDASASWLVCEKICVPGRADLSLTLPVSQVAAPANQELFQKYLALVPKQARPPFETHWERRGDNLVLQVTGVGEGKAVEFFPLPPPGVLAGHPVVDGNTVVILGTEKVSALPGVLVIKDGTQQTAWQLGGELQQSTPGKSGISYFLLLSFVGGFILNLMPCVLPVIALKIFGFIQQAGETRARILRLGLAFVAGIFAWFMAMAALVSIFKAAGHELNWSFQFQHAGFLIGMMIVVLLFALNLLGLFEITLPGRTSTTLSEVSAHEGYGGAFLHGMFATLMATPCTAPFLGPALGFAFAQSPGVIFLMFGAIAAGMSFPYLVLSARPEWIRFLPKPGMWMVRVKQAMGVLLLGTFLWLGWVLWQQQTTKREPFTPQLEQALAQNKTVFVDFTADWCVNCKVNEKLVLNTEPIQRAFREQDVIFLRADWTNGDAEITKLLRSFGRAAVPAYVIYPAGKRDQPIVLPELLTQKIVLEALAQAKE